MSDAPRPRTTPLHAVPALARLHIDLNCLREILEHIGAREIAGTIELTRRVPSRQVLIVTLDDAEHLVLLGLDHDLAHWDATREPVERLRRRLRQWLAQTPSFAEASHRGRHRPSFRPSSPRSKPTLAPVPSTRNPDEAPRLTHGGDECGQDL